MIQANSTNYRLGRNDSIQYIVIHYTANDGDTAKNNCNYFQGENRGASAHYFVDENGYEQSVYDKDTAWHSGRDYSGGSAPYWGKCTNANSLGIEMCSDIVGSEYVITQSTQDNAIALTKLLMDKYGVPASNVIRHYDVCGKICPQPFVNHPDQWVTFKSRLNGSQESVEVSDEFEPYTIRQTTSNGLNIRNGAGTNYDVVGCIKDRVKYTIVEEQNGWGRLRSGAGWIYLGYTKRA